MGIFSVGTSGLNAAQVGILTTSHNISNASTAGYNRQEIVQGTNIPVLTGAGFIGQGTHVATVKRVYDQFLSRQVLSAETGAAEMDSYRTQIEQLDNLLADPSAGLSPALSDFFKGVQEMAANPSSIPGRQSMLSSAQSLVARFQSLEQRMAEVRDGTNSQIMGMTTQINTYATQIAETNQRIIMAESGSLTQAPNDLLDQRDQMIRELNKLVRVSTVTQSDGSYNVFFGNGQPLVIGSEAYSLAAVASTEDSERIVVAMVGGGGVAQPLPESQITGGALGGLLSFRSETLDSAQNALGRIALTLGQNFNDQHKLGMDLTGQLGTNFFSLPAPTLKANSANALATGPTVAIDPATIDRLTTSDYRLTNVGGAFQLIRLSDNAVTAITTQPQIVDGMSIDTTGWGVAANDSYLIQPTRAAARNISVAFTDARQIAAAAPIRTSAPLTNTGTGSIDAGLVVNTTTAEFGTFNATGDILPPVLIRFTTANTYDIVNKTTNAVIEGGIAYTAGAAVFPTPAAWDPGYRVKISGTPAAGDSFVVEGNKNGVADNRNAQLLGALQTKTTMAGSTLTAPTASYQSAYSQIVSQVGSKAAEVIAVGNAQQGLVDHAIQSQQQLSGVNLDEEAANLMRYQQAYQASAKILEIAGKIFDDIIALGR